MNQREIKFRAWIKPELKMVEVYSLEWTNLELAVSWLDNETTTGKREVMAPFNYELMQFTGLHDKNGKEIYEGDILWNGKYSEGNGKKIVTIVKNREQEPLSGYNYFWGGYEVDLDYPQSMEVVGNIYENPNLIEAAQVR